MESNKKHILNKHTVKMVIILCIFLVNCLIKYYGFKKTIYLLFFLKSIFMEYTDKFIIRGKFVELKEINIHTLN